MPEHPLEFSRPLDLEHICSDKGHQHISATPEECLNLAKRFGIRAINRFSCRVSVVECQGHLGGYDLEGVVEAEITQSCIATLEDVPQEIQTNFSVLVLEPSKQKELYPGQEDEEDIEFLEDGVLDVGEIAAQYLALAIDPFPRSSSAPEKLNTSVEDKQSPFSVLEKLLKPEGQ